MVEGMSVVVIVMLSLMSVTSPPPAMCNLSTRTVVKLCTRVCLLRGELGFLNFDDICMCVVNKQYELPDFVLIPSMFTCSMMRFIPLHCWICVLVWYLWSSWSVCEVVLVPYVDEVFPVIVMRILLFMFHVCMLRECEGARVTAMLVWGMEEVWWWWVHDIWVVHVVQVLF